MPEQKEALREKRSVEMNFVHKEKLELLLKRMEHLKESL